MSDSADYLEKARSSYVGARACLERQAFDSCVSRCYYAVFQGAIAALIQLTDFRPVEGEWSHKATQAEFNRRLVMRRKIFSGQVGRTLLTLIEWRHRADYAPTNTGHQIARTSVALAEGFLSAIQAQLEIPMGRRAHRFEKLPQETRSALADYLVELEKVYPEGMKKYQVVPWSEYGEGSYLVKISPPEDEEKWMKLSERMAEVGTRILVESDQLFILAG